jgi:halocyanin-like protein
MSDHDVDERRRTVLKATAAAATAGALGASGVATAGAREETLGDWLSNVSNFESVADRTGESEVRISVGASGNNGSFAFAPPAVRVDPGTTVIWEWTGKGSQHNVVAKDGSFESETTGKSGFTFERTFEEAGAVPYACAPHKAMGMKGAVLVGDVEVDLSAAKGSGEDGDSGEGSGDSDSGSDGGDGDESPTYLDEEPDYGDWFDGVDNYEGTVDRTGESEVRIAVGAEGNGGPYAFDPPAVQVDPGTTVIWEWTGESDAEHDVVAETGDYASEVFGEAGAKYGLTFETAGISKYVCSDHAERGMRGAVVVGDVTSDPDEGALKMALLGLAGAIVAAPAVASRFLGDG